MRTPVAIVMVIVVATHHIVIQKAAPGWHLPTEILVYGVVGPILSWTLLGWLARSVEAAEKAGEAQAESAANLARRKSEIEALYNASRLLTGARSLAHIASALLQLAMQITRAESGALVIFEADDSDGPIAPAAGAEGHKMRADLLAHIEAGPCLTCPDCAECPLPKMAKCMPIVAGRHVLGILRLWEPAWEPEPRRSLDALLSEIAAVWMARQAESRALTAFSKVGQELRGDADIGQVLTRFSELICDASGATAACLFHRRHGEWTLRASSRSARQPPPPESMPHGSEGVWHERKGRFVYVLVNAECLLALDFGAARPLNRRDTDLLKSLASQAHVLATITHRMSETIWSERQRTAQELHDGLAQNIAFLNLQIHRLVEKADIGAAGIRADLRKLSEAALDSYDELRITIGDLRWHPDDGENSITFLRRVAAAFARRESIIVRLDAPADLSLTDSVLAHVTRIVQEALSNAVRHGAARQVEITLTPVANGAALDMAIHDNGTGFDTTDTVLVEDHYGFKTMQERAANMSGRMWIESRLEQGTTLHFHLPGAISATTVGGPDKVPVTAK